MLFFNNLVFWYFSISNCCKPLFPFLYNCQLLCFCPPALSIAVEVFPQPFFPDIAPSRMFATNSLCLIVCPTDEWRLLLKISRVDKIEIYIFTGGLISSLTDKKGKKLQRQKILMFIYPIYDQNWRNMSTIYTVLIFDASLDIQGVPGGMYQTSGECSLC